MASARIDTGRAGEKTLAAATATIAKTPLTLRRIAQGALEIPPLKPGTYQVVAVIKQDGQPIAHVARTVVRR